MTKLGWTLRETIGIGIINPGSLRTRTEVERLYIDVLKRGFKVVDARWEDGVFVIAAEMDITLIQDFKPAEIRPIRRHYRLKPND